MGERAGFGWMGGRDLLLTFPLLPVDSTSATETEQLLLDALRTAVAELEAERSQANDVFILLRWSCEACGWSTVTPAPDYPGTGYDHWDGDTKCGPLVARRVPGFLRAHPGASTEEIQQILSEFIARGGRP